MATTTVNLNTPSSATSVNVVVEDSIVCTIQKFSASTTWTSSVSASTGLSVALSTSSGNATSTTISFTGSGTYSVTFSSTRGSAAEPIDTQHTVSGTVITIAPPSSIGITIATNDSANANVTATPTAPAGGLVSGDVLKVGQNSGSGVSYGTSTSFTQTRGVAGTYKYWAITYRTNSVYSTAINSGVTHIEAPYLASETGTASSVTITSAATSATIPISGISSAGVETEISLSNNATRLGGATGSTNVTITSSLPAAGTSASYRLLSRRPISKGGASDTWSFNNSFTITRQAAPPDTTPDQFSFTDAPGVATGSEQTSSITVGGINATTNVTISGGTYSKNGSSYTSASTTAALNDTFEVKHTASSFNNTSVNTTLTIGGVSDTFTSTTVAATGPTAPTTIALASATQSASPTNVSVTAYGGTAGSVAYVGTTANGLFFDNGTDGFTATRGVPKTFYAYNTLNSIDSSTVGLSGTLPYITLGTVANTTISATATSATIAVSGATANASTNIKGYISGTLTNLATGNGTGNGALTITSGMPAQNSTTPITLYFYTKTPIADGGNNQWVYKGSFTLTRAAGVDPPTDITFVPLGTENPLTDVTATVVGSTGYTPRVGLQVISTTAGVVTTGTVAGSGGYQNAPYEFTGLARGNTTTGTTYVYRFYAYNLETSGSYSTTISRDYPVPYLDNPDLDVTLGADVTITSSSTSDVTISLADYSANTQYRLYNIPEAGYVSIYNGSSTATPQFTISYSENELPPSGTTDTTWTYTVQGRHISTYGGNPNGAFQAFSTPEQVTVTRSAAANTAPDAFDLEASSGLPVVGAAQDADFLSDTITVAGLDTSTTISISGTGSPTYSKNSDAYTDTTGTVVNDDTIRVKVHSASSGNTQVTGTLNIGGVTDTFSVTTASSGTGLDTLPITIDYGLALRNASGTLVLKPQARVLNFQGSGSVQVYTTESGVKVSSWQTSPHCNSPSKVLVSVAGGESNLEKCVPETRAHPTTANPNLDEWRFKAGTNTNSTVKYIIVRYG